MSRLGREPLVHFVVVGAALWGIHALTRPADEAPPIVVDEALVAGLERQHAQRTGRPPEDPDQLVDDWVREEVLLREALRLGLERDDPIVRRRLVQKMELLLAAAAEPAPPDDATLAAYLAEHADAFGQAERVAFEQAFFARERHPDAEAAAQEALAAGEPSGDPFPLGRVQSPIDHAGLAGRYGPAFAAAVFALEGEGWQGPVTSRFGAHLVRLTTREPARPAELAEVRPAVERAWRREVRERRTGEAIRALVERADVVRP
ncbi:MAG: hypothetical protein CMN30_18505 [Sandaracinus sp.]|nr:hypothetical protein [Sandaracinus sp.]